MSDTINAQALETEQEFPASTPGKLNKIPKPVILAGIFILIILMIVVTFPGKSKAKKHLKSSVLQTEKVDSYEQQSPITTDPFSTKTVDNTSGISNPIERNAALGSSVPQMGQGGEAVVLNSSTPADPSSSAPQERNYTRGSIPQEEQVYVLPKDISDRLNGSYQDMVKHFRGTRQHAVEPVEGDAYNKLLERDRLERVEPTLKNLTENSAKYANKALFSVPSGTRIRAVSLQEVNSDHPGYFTARINSPMELAGYKLLCQSRGNARDRIPVTVDKIVAPDGKTETQIPGEVQMKYAGLEGDIRSHAIRRLVPPVASAFLGAGAGFLYFKAIGGDQLNSETGRINTADAVVSAPFEKGVTGVQNEIERFGGDYPNTVVVPQGTQFEILVTEQFSIEL
jgi:hypothetical protein